MIRIIFSGEVDELALGDLEQVDKKRPSTVNNTIARYLKLNFLIFIRYLIIQIEIFEPGLTRYLNRDHSIVANSV